MDSDFSDPDFVESAPDPDKKTRIQNSAIVDPSHEFTVWHYLVRWTFKWEFFWQRYLSLLNFKHYMIIVVHERGECLTSWLHLGQKVHLAGATMAWHGGCKKGAQTPSTINYKIYTFFYLSVTLYNVIFSIIITTLFHVFLATPLPPPPHPTLPHPLIPLSYTEWHAVRYRPRQWA